MDNDKPCSEWERPVNGFPEPNLPRNGTDPLVNLHQMKFNKKTAFLGEFAKKFRNKKSAPKKSTPSSGAELKSEKTEDKTDWKQILFQSERRVLITRLIPDFRWLWV